MSISQKELLSEGFWDHVRGGFRVAKDVARAVAPEITNPLDKTISKVRDWKRLYKQGYEGAPTDSQMALGKKDNLTSNVASSIVDSIKLGLTQQGYTLIPKYGINPLGVDSHNGNKLFKVKALSKAFPKGEWIIVNVKGMKK